jgi:hypothetical protein
MPKINTMGMSVWDRSDVDTNETTSVIYNTIIFLPLLFHIK